MEEENKIQLLNFGNAQLPLPVEGTNKSDSSYITWGNDNKYPSYLLGLYGKSPIFANIINQKASFIIGGGLIDLNTNKPLVNKPNPSDTWELFTDKIVKSFLLFNMFAVEVNFNAFGDPIYWNPISFEQIRLNGSVTEVWVNKDWSKRNDALQFPRFFPEKDYAVEEKTTSKVFIYNGYIPSSAGGVYSLPEYYSLLRNLSIDIEITEFNLSNIVNGFSVSTLINVYQNADEASKKAFNKKIEESYTGVAGKRHIVSYNNLSDKARPTEITPLSAGDWATQYESIRTSNNETIFLGMGIVNPSIFGYKSAGSLGNTQELENSYEILSKNIISTKRNELEAALREMLNMNVSFLDVPLFQTTLSDDMKKAVLTINEIRETAGLKPLTNGSGDVLLSATSAPATTFTLSPTKFESKDEWEKVSATDEHFEAIKHLGTDKSQFKTYEGTFSMAKLQFSDESDIAQFLINTKLENVTLDEIKKAIREKLGINVSIDELQNHIDEVVKTGVIAVDKSGDTLTIKQGEKLLDPVEKRTIETVYEYVKRIEASGETKIATTRPFCEKIIDMKKYFTLEDIQSISAVLNYDVFVHTGGFWRQSGTTGKGNATNTKPHCRHEWKQVQVVRKPKDNL